MSLFFVAGVFAPIAAIMAFVITYDEWSRHFLARDEIVKKSLSWPRSART